MMKAYVLKSDSNIVDGSLIYNILNHKVTRAITDSNPYKDWWNIDIVVTSDESMDIKDDDRDWKPGDILLDGKGQEWYVVTEELAMKIVSKNDPHVIRNFELGIYHHGSVV